MKSLYIVAAALLLGVVSIPSMAQMRIVELGYETSPANVRMPTSDTGELTMQGCATCKVVRLRVTAATRYVIGGEQVSLAEMTHYLAQNPESSLVVMQLKDTSNLSRLVVHVPKRAQ